MEKTAKRIVIERSIWIMIFLLFAWAFNFSLNYTKNEMLLLAVNFLNNNLKIILSVMLLSIVAEVLFSKEFPFDLFAPAVTSAVAVFTVILMINALKFVGAIINFNSFNAFDDYKYMIFIIVIVLTLILGYAQVFSRFLDKMDALEAAKKMQSQVMYVQNTQHPVTLSEQITENKKTEDLSWGEVNKEYKQAFYSFAKSLRSFFDTKIRK